MGYARYVGRVGALAVALGVGAAQWRVPGWRGRILPIPARQVQIQPSTPSTGSTPPTGGTSSLGSIASTTNAMTSPVSSPGSAHGVKRDALDRLQPVGVDPVVDESDEHYGDGVAGVDGDERPRQWDRAGDRWCADTSDFSSPINPFRLATGATAIAPSTNGVATAPAAGLPADLTAVPIGGPTGPATASGPLRRRLLVCPRALRCRSVVRPALQLHRGPLPSPVAGVPAGSAAVPVGGSTGPVTAAGPGASPIATPSTNVSAQQVVSSPQPSAPVATSTPVLQMPTQSGITVHRAGARRAPFRRNRFRRSRPPRPPCRAPPLPRRGRCRRWARWVGVVPGAPAGDSPVLLAMLGLRTQGE